MVISVTNFIFFKKEHLQRSREKEVEQAKHGNWQYWSIKMSFAKLRSSINQYENNKLIKSTSLYDVRSTIYISGVTSNFVSVGLNIL